MLKFNPVVQFSSCQQTFLETGICVRGVDKRGSEGAEIKTPKASRGEDMGRGRLQGLGERLKLPSGVQGVAPAENEFWST